MLRAFLLLCLAMLLQPLPARAAPVSAQATSGPTADDPQAMEKAARTALTATPGSGIARAERLLDLAQALEQQNKLAEAEPLLREALALMETHDAPRALRLRADFVRANILLAQDRFADAEPLARAVIAAHGESASHARADSHVQLARILLGLKRWQEAGEMADAGYHLRVKLLGATNLRTLNALGYLARARVGQNRPAEAEALMRQVLAGRKAGGDPAYVVDATIDYAGFLFEQGRYADSLPLFREALALAKAHFADDPAFIAWRNLELGRALYRAEKADAEAETFLRAGLATLDKGNAASAGELYDWLYDLARLASIAGRNSEAEGIYRRLLAAEEAAGNGDAAWVAGLIGELAHVLMSQTDGQTIGENPRLPEARKLLERQVALVERRKGASSMDLSLPLARLAIVLRWQRERDAARALSERRLALYPDTPGLARAEALLESEAYLELPQAMARVEAARAMVVAIGGDNAAYLNRIDERLVQLVQAQGDLSRAEQIRRDILARHLAGSNRQAAARAQVLLAFVLVSRGNDELAAATATDGMRALEQLGQGESIETGYARQILGEIAQRRGDLVTAEREMRAAIAIYDARIPGGYARMMAQALGVLGDTLLRQARAPEAIPLLARARAIHTRWFGAASSDTAHAGMILARAYGDAGQRDQAAALFALSYHDLAAGLAPGSPFLIEPSRHFARFALSRNDPALARTLLRRVAPLIVERAARAAIDADAARELGSNRAALMLAVRANWELAAR